MTGADVNPFKGLDPYVPGERLFGRDADMLVLKDRIFRGKTTLLFAGSGVGKTSFLQAKVIPEIEQRYRDQFAVRYHREWAGKDPLSALKARLGAPVSESLPDFFRSRSGDGTKTWLVVLDQFEELFQYHVYLPYFDDFRNELSAAISAPDTPVRFVFSIREEYLGQLSAFDNRVPDLFANYFRPGAIADRLAGDTRDESDRLPSDPGSRMKPACELACMSVGLFRTEHTAVFPQSLLHAGEN
jgi:hypothetical protein